ncbi:hypothetical protein [Paraburkholderia ginsengisoli]|uniref:Uncharacterized protein n=1 Tax=Paraburkholderia ginsengisoli TaxID=311231 RepID=A0A7T4N252_9BURK|nr:hypothetical protein [Paraburkholderia ginsengisoli]QQC63865.1 hypothetical protein I6I06_16500 [Paraburkholderia ginsengisoli]
MDNFYSRGHGPVSDAIGQIDFCTTMPVGGLADNLAKVHAVSQGLAAILRIARADGLARERDASETGPLLAPGAVDALLALGEVSAGMLADDAEALAEWIGRSARVADDGIRRASGSEDS